MAISKIFGLVIQQIFFSEFKFNLLNQKCFNKLFKENAGKRLIMERVLPLSMRKKQTHRPYTNKVCIDVRCIIVEDISLQSKLIREK